MALAEMEQAKEIDIYRDTPLRFLGYTNEVGEAFRPLIHKTIVNLSYASAFLYVLADVRDKVVKMKKSLSTIDETSSYTHKKVIIAGADTLLWQTLASIAIPGFTINRICAANYYILKKATKLPKPTRKYITTAVGLLSIPFIIHPIDDLTTYSMDNSIRKLYHKN
ncbi:Mitochondrial fission process protein 1 [Frankliniella fusca]|uniref:Mitochondrial fission process protein 1 n=1 Tax=Frankliniella fusca TaxID=407009 RepID=A0AAE1LTK4_9NEOP|nr:Mitochondrial fission process protein 1 [Frankliniella fusca]